MLDINNPLDQKKIADNAKDITCDCGHNVFAIRYTLKTISKLITGDAQDALIPTQVFICQSCGTVLPLT